MAKQATLYSIKSSGDVKLSPHFMVREFACNDGSDAVLIDDRLVVVLEDIRTHVGGKPVQINSGYRTVPYNKKVGGATNSQHLLGTAADVTVAQVKPKELCLHAELALLAAGIQGGIGLYKTFCHVDVRAARSRWDETSGRQVVVSGFLPTLRRSTTGDDVKALQIALNRHGYALIVDGVFGANTEMTIKSRQRVAGLLVDGIVGPKTWAVLG